jgi:hypothetical protein
VLRQVFFLSFGWGFSPGVVAGWVLCVVLA